MGGGKEGGPTYIALLPALAAPEPVSDATRMHAHMAVTPLHRSGMSHIMATPHGHRTHCATSSSEQVCVPTPPEEASAWVAMAGPAVPAKRRRTAGAEISWHEGCPIAACPLPGGLASLLKEVVADGISLGLSSTRPAHRGLIFGWGRCVRWSSLYKGTEELRAKVEQLQEQTLLTSASKAMQSVTGLPLPMSMPGSQQFFSLSYSPVAAPEYRWLQHPPPPQHASSGVTSCRQACELCHLLGCHSCPNCALHVDRGDKSLSIFLGWQSSEAPASVAAHFCCGDRSFSLQGGIVVVFDGKNCKHGVWAPSHAGSGAADWYGTALVVK